MNPVILIVDDDADIRETLGAYLDMEGYEVVLAKDGREGLDKLRAGLKPCLILLDHVMTGMNGAQFIAAVAKELPQIHRNSPILLMTALKEPNVPGVTEFLKKPFNVAELIEKVTMHCGEPALAK